MRIRTFVAVNPSIAVARRIADEVERHRPTVGANGERLRVAWVAPASYHVTLQFLGHIEEELVEAIAGQLRQVAARHRAFDLKVKGFGAFNSVLWVGADGGEALLKLQREVEAALFEIGLPKEERKFHPHLTVGRVKEGSAAWASETELGMSQVSEMVLYESKTAPGKSAGAEYVARARVALAK